MTIRIRGERVGFVGEDVGSLGGKSLVGDDVLVVAAGVDAVDIGDGMGRVADVFVKAGGSRSVAAMCVAGRLAGLQEEFHGFCFAGGQVP